MRSRCGKRIAFVIAAALSFWLILTRDRRSDLIQSLTPSQAVDDSTGKLAGVCADSLIRGRRLLLGLAALA